VGWREEDEPVVSELSRSILSGLLEIGTSEGVMRTETEMGLVLLEVSLLKMELLVAPALCSVVCCGVLAAASFLLSLALSKKLDMIFAMLRSKIR